MNYIEPLIRTDLHVHPLQSLYPEDVFELAKDCYREIDWNRYGFLDRYERAFGSRPDPVSMFSKAIVGSSLSELKDLMTYRYHSKGNFEEFDIKSFSLICVAGYYLDKGDLDTLLQTIVERHQKEGLTYIEYRLGVMFRDREFKEEWKETHLKYARFFRNASGKNFQARYIIRAVNGIWDVVKELLKENPDLSDTIVGVDFTGRELPPESLRKYYEEMKEDCRVDPEHALDIVVHTGETFWDKSLESAIRWCHQYALLGTKRLAHCVALGLDPEVAIRRKEHAHEYETVSERIDQIQYDMEHMKGLANSDVTVNSSLLNNELTFLREKDLEELVRRTYDEDRLAEVRKRQDYVLLDLKRIGTVIETCPTSNLCIGTLPGIYAHPFKKLYDSGVNLAICTDDPGTLATNLENEVRFVLENFNITEAELSSRLGDPYRFRLRAEH